MNLPRVIVRGLPAQLRQSETRLFLVALVFAVAALASVQLAAKRTLDLLQERAAAINGGDLRLSSRSPIADDWRQQARAMGLRSADSLGFPTMLFAGEGQQLTDIKAVSGDYPVRGELRVRLAGQAADSVVAAPSPGQAWADPRLLQALAVDLGDMVELGAIQLRLAGEVIEDPDGNQLFAMAPSLIVAQEDAARAGLLGPGSRPGYRLFLAGPARAIDDYAAWLEPQLQGGQRLSRIEDAAEQLRGTYERGRSFIDLAVLLTLALTVLAMWLSLARLAEREAAGAALMRCLGASRHEVLLLPLGQILLLTLPAAALGLGLGWLAEDRLAQSLAARLDSPLPPADLLAALPTLLALLVLLLMCVLPPLAGLLRVPPLRALQASASQPGNPVRWLALPLLGLPLAGLLLGGQPRLVLIVLLGLAGAAALCAGLVWLCLRLLALALATNSGLGRLAVMRLVRRPFLAILQGTALAVALTALLLTVRIGPDMLDRWQQQLPVHTPNWFVLNIQPGQRQAVLDHLGAAGASSIGMMPVANGRFVSINGQPASSHEVAEGGAQRWRDGPINLSWSEQLPAGNTLAAGDWWTASDSEPLLSLEQQFAERLGLAVGDRLTLAVGDRQLEGHIANLRQTQWDSFNVNFFVMINPAAAAAMDHAYITSFHLPADAASAIAGLTGQFSNLSPIDVGAILERIRQMIGELAGAARGLLGLALFAAILVLLGALAYAQAERRREAALLRALGIARHELTALLAVEWLLLALTAAMVATALAAGTGWLLARQVFRFAYLPGIALPAVALAVALAVCTVAAIAAARTATRVPPAESLRL